jgi:AcrR family transcriptional regulator
LHAVRYVNASWNAHPDWYLDVMNHLEASNASQIRRLTREEARQITRERLLKAAAELFRRQGYAGASLEAVAEAAGFTKGAVYSNFATKVDLYIALMERYVAAETGAQRRLLEDQALDAFLDGLQEKFVRQVKQDPLSVVLDIEFWLAASRDPQIREKIVAGAEAWRTQMGQVIDQQLARAGVKSQLSGRELGIILHALAGGLALNHHLEPDAIDPELLVRAARVLVGLDPPLATIRSRPSKARRSRSRPTTAASTFGASRRPAGSSSRRVSSRSSSVRLKP